MMRGSQSRLRLRTTQVLRCIARGVHDVAAAAGLEFAVVAPVLILAGVGTVDIGFATYRSSQLDSAARAGSEYARLHGFDSIAISNAVVNATQVPGIAATPAPIQYCGCASSTGIGNVDCSLPCPGGSMPGTYVTVSAQATYTTIVPYPFFATSYQLSGQSTIRVQ